MSRCFQGTGCLGLPWSSPPHSSFLMEVTNQVSPWPGMALPLSRGIRTTSSKSKMAGSPRLTRTPSTLPSVLLRECQAREVQVNFLCCQEGFSAPGLPKKIPPSNAKCICHLNWSGVIILFGAANRAIDISTRKSPRFNTDLSLIPVFF